jgi:ribosomal protein S12 methylthiotransferase
LKTTGDKQLINIITLGCSKNVVDSEFLMKQLDAGNFQVIYDSNSTKADIVIINTCGFIKDAKQESIDAILQFVNAKKQGKIKRVFVMGCLSERYKDDLRKEIPGVDKYFGTEDLESILNTLGVDYRKELLGERLLTTPNHYAYLKISEGCNRTCSFCAIPLMRGKYKSKSIETLVSETGLLANQGVKELILIAQDLTYYGTDIYSRQKLADLLKYLSDVQGIEWIKLLYAYPANFPLDIVQVMKERENICNYIDIPFQHISDNVLSKMRRGINKEQTNELIDYLRSEIPGIAMRTSLMTGHPGEGKEEFEELLQFVKQVKFDRLGVFTYSEEEDTYSAKNFEDSVPAKVKRERADIIMKEQMSISLLLNEKKIGTKVKVIVDRKEGNYYICRTEHDAPEVDNEVLVPVKGKKLDIGGFYTMKIESADEYDLYAK